MKLDTVATAVVVFVSTNIDDILILSLLFADTTFRPSAVVLGQFIGIGTLVLISAAAGLAAVAIPTGWIPLLGAIPLVVGLYKLVGLVRSRTSEDDTYQPVVTVSRDRFGYSAILSVIGITLANGGDNLSVYIPLFAADRTQIAVYICVFSALTGIWCWLGHRFVNSRILGQKLQQYGHIVLPVVLICIGAHILLQSQCE